MPRSIPPLPAVLCLCLVVGCGRGDEVPRSTVVIGAQGVPETINDLVAKGSDFDSALIRRLFPTLVRERPDFQQGPPTFEPYLATSWSSSEDGRVLEFGLRRDARWSDGQPITAADVHFTWQAQTSPEVGWVYSFVKQPIESVEVIDDHTVRFHFDHTYPTQILDANEGVILPRHAFSELPFAEWPKQPLWFLEHLVSAGPFLLERWEPQRVIELVRNPDYFEPGLPKLDRVIFRYVQDTSLSLVQLQAGEIDLAPSVRPSDASRVVAEKDLTLDAYPTRQYDFVTWNTRRPFFRDAAVRRALAHAVDRRALIDTLWFGHARIATSPVISSVWAHDESLEPWVYDPEEARRLLSEAGWTDDDGDGIRERDGVAFSFELTTNPGSEVRWDAMQMIAEQLRQVGVEAKPRRLDIRQLNALNLAHDYDATVSAFAIDTTLDLTYAFHSRAIDDGYNFGSYSDPEVDRLIDEFNAAPDQRQALPLLLRVQQILHRDQPFLFLWEPERLLAHRRGLTDVGASALGEYENLRYWQWTSPAATGAE